jgi:hypothetical protein
MDTKLTRIFLIIFMAFAVCAFVSFEDTRESDDAFSRSSEMLREAKHELLVQHDVRRIAAPVCPSRSQTKAFADGGTSSPTLLSLTTCILRC